MGSVEQQGMGNAIECRFDNMTQRGNGQFGERAKRCGDNAPYKRNGQGATRMNVQRGIMRNGQQHTVGSGRIGVAEMNHVIQMEWATRNLDPVSII